MTLLTRIMLVVAGLGCIVIAFIIGQLVGAERVYHNRFLQESALIEQELTGAFQNASLIQDSQGRAVIVVDKVDQAEYAGLRGRLMDRFGIKYVDHALSGVHLPRPPSSLEGGTDDNEHSDADSPRE